ncbi:MAG: site-specific integrase [Chitinophagales bacterium]
MELHPLKIRFYPKANCRGQNQYTLYMRITIAGKRTDLSLNYALRRDLWDDRNQCLKGRHKDTGYVINLTNLYRQKAQEIYQSVINRGDECDVNTIRQKIKGEETVTQYGHTLISLFDRTIARKNSLSGPNNTIATIYKYKRCKRHLLVFIKKYYSATDLKFSQLNLQFIEDFELFLKTDGKCCHNTSMKHIRTLKTVFKTAQAHGYTDKDPFQKYKIRLEEVVRDYLTELELRKIIEYDKLTECLEKVRDLFVFTCFTGLAYIDLKNLKATNIQFENGKYWIRSRRQKTGIKSNIPLLAIPLNILQKYHPNLESSDGDQPVFEVISNQKMNSYLKVLASKIGVKKKLSCHIARHTFATTITLNNGVPIESVSSMLGHRYITTTQHYAKLLDKKLATDMELLQSKLNF